MFLVLLCEEAGVRSCSSIAPCSKECPSKGIDALPRTPFPTHGVSSPSFHWLKDPVVRARLGLVVMPLVVHACCHIGTNERQIRLLLMQGEGVASGWVLPGTASTRDVS